MQRSEDGIGLEDFRHSSFVVCQLDLEMAVLGNEQFQPLGIQRVIHAPRFLGQLDEHAYGFLVNSLATKPGP
ncbi:hypothetical protein D3C86_1908240 [compost metagenome]